MRASLSDFVQNDECARICILSPYFSSHSLEVQKMFVIFFVATNDAPPSFPPPQASATLWTRSPTTGNACASGTRARRPTVRIFRSRHMHIPSNACWRPLLKMGLPSRAPLLRRAAVGHWGHHHLLRGLRRWKWEMGNQLPPQWFATACPLSPSPRPSRRSPPEPPATRPACAQAPSNSSRFASSRFPSRFDLESLSQASRWAWPSPA